VPSFSTGSRGNHRGRKLLSLFLLVPAALGGAVWMGPVLGMGSLASKLPQTWAQAAPFLGSSLVLTVMAVWQSPKTPSGKQAVASKLVLLGKITTFLGVFLLLGGLGLLIVPSLLQPFSLGLSGAGALALSTILLTIAALCRAVATGFGESSYGGFDDNWGTSPSSHSLDFTSPGGLSGGMSGLGGGLGGAHGSVESDMFGPITPSHTGSHSPVPTPPPPSGRPKRRGKSNGPTF
jgi:hypothetical protein